MTEGIWNLKVWTVDDAGNTCADGTIFSKTLYVDETKPEIVNNGVLIEQINTSLWAAVGNFLTFGNFFKEAIQITVQVKDVTSGPATLYYQVTSTYEEPKISSFDKENNAISVKDITDGVGTATLTFDIDSSDLTKLLDGYIWVYAVDEAGNASDPIALKVSTSGEDVTYWMIDIASPTITLTLTDSENNERSSSDWFNIANSTKDGTITITPEVIAIIKEGFTDDNVSGINLVTRKLQVYDESAEEYVTYNSADAEVTLYTAEGKTEAAYTQDTEFLTDYYQMDELPDGRYQVVYTVTDNAGNVTPKSVEVLIDITAPTATVDKSEISEDPDNVPQLVTVTPTDATSGVAYVVVTPSDATGGSISTDSEGSDATTTALTLEPEADGNVSFYVCENGTYEIVVYDVAGNPSETYTVTVSIIDTDAPTITGTSPADGAGSGEEGADEAWDYNTTTITVTIQDNNADGLKYVDGSIIINVNGTDYTVPASAVSGLTTPTGTGTDEQGNTVYVYTVTIDLTQAKDDDGNTLTSTTTYTVTDPSTGEVTTVTTDPFLDASTEYTVTIPAEAFTDAATNALEEGTEFSFTTEEAQENDPWMAAKALTSLDLAVWMENEGEYAPNFEYLVIDPGTYDPDSSTTYTVYYGSDEIVDYAAGELKENLVILVPADEAEDCNVTVDVVSLADVSLSVNIDETTYTVTTYVEVEGQEPEEVTKTYTAYIISAEDLNNLQDKYCYIEVTTENYGTTNTYKYLLSLSGVSESTNNQTSADGTETGVTVTPGTMISALRSSLYDVVSSGSEVVLQFIASAPRESVIQDEIAAIKSALSSRWQGRTMFYFDFNVNMVYGNTVEEITEVDLEEYTYTEVDQQTGETVTKIGTRPVDYIELTIEIPSEIQGESAYAVYYYHNGGAYLLGETDDGTGMVVFGADENTLVIQTWQYCVYAITGKVITSSGSSGSSDSGSSSDTVYVTNTVTETVTRYVPTSGKKGSTTVAANDADDTTKTSPQTDGTGDTGTGDEETEEASGGSVCEGIPVGLALINLLFLVGSIMTAEYSTLKQKKKKKIPNDILCMAALILFFVTQPLHGLLAWVDKWTPLFAIIFAVQLVITVIKLKADGEEPEEAQSQNQNA